MQQSITELIKPPHVLDADDSVRRAAGFIRASGGTRMLVAKEGRVAGSISEQAIASFLASAEDPEEAYGEPIEPLVEQYPLYVNASVSVQDAARVFAESGVDTLPVVDQYGELRGVLHRGDVIGYLTNNLRPASVGGMATPLGVYLTTGSISGGAGSLGLYLTGISLGVMMVLSKVFGDRAMVALQSLAMHKLPLAMRAHMTPDLLMFVSTVISIGLMLVMLRMSPLAGYHAAEHMTVHAIERGEDLIPKAVRRMPRVHPRCGTNIMGALAIFILITSEFGGEMAAMVAIVIVMLGRRAIGDWMQAFFTTKPPSEHQLRDGIAAGSEILSRFRERPNYQAQGFSRIWNMGILQSAAGMTTVMFVVYFVEKLLHVPVMF